MIKFSPIINDLPSTVPFVGPEAQERQRNQKFLLRIGANESVFGPSPKVIDEVKKLSSDIWMYADPESFDLKVAVASHNNVKLENIVIGEGIDGLLGYLCRLFVNPNTNVVTSRGAYPTFNYHVTGFGGTINLIPYKNDYEDIEGLLSETKKTKAKLIYLANPDNPMGTFHSKSIIEDMVQNLPEGVLLCLDEAYSEFVPKNELADIDPKNPQVIRMRTFSKGYGMAGVRIGYAIGSKELIKSFDKIRNHFGINIIGQRAALVALADQEYLEGVISSVSTAKKEIGIIAQDSGLSVVRSFANFVAIDCGRDEVFAKLVLNALIERNIFVRMPFFEPQNRCIRISAGKPADLRILANELPAVLKGLRINKHF